MMTQTDFNMVTLMRIVVLLCFVISFGCATFQTEYERLVFSFNPGERGSGWEIGYSTEIPNQYSLIEFIREGDDINNWYELLSLQNFPPLWGGPSPEDAMNELMFLRKKVCPGKIKWNVINKDEKSILYEWQARPCLKWAYHQHEIARIIYGKYNSFVLHYVQKKYQMPEEERLKWIRVFSVAKIETSFK